MTKNDLNWLKMLILKRVKKIKSVAVSWQPQNVCKNQLIPGGQFSQGTKHILSHLKIFFEQNNKHTSIMSKLVIKSNISEIWHMYCISQSTQTTNHQNIII